jgi:hypothetical protein
MTQVLRYPYEAITDSTDYLQITISEYKPARTDLIRTNLINQSNEKVGDTKSRVLNKQSLKEAGGVILLPMPSNIQDGNSVSYADDSLDSLTAKMFSGSEKVMNTNYTGNPTQMNEEVGRRIGLAADNILATDGLKDIAMKSLAAQATSVFGGNVTLNQVLARENGSILNPNMELLFNGVTLRTFRFSFKMTPRDDKESQQINLIIRSLKRNMAAKSGGEGKNTFLNAPNIFELRYRSGNIDHKFLHKFKPCALTDMVVNYTGENVYATYGDGTPISMTMDLTFKELVPIYESDYNDSDTTVGY